MKSAKTPKDGKTFCANGRRFESMDQVHTYASERNMFVSNFEKVGVFTMCDLSSYDEGPELTQSEILDLHNPL